MWPGESEKMLLFELKACVKETVVYIMKARVAYSEIFHL